MAKKTASSSNEQNSNPQSRSACQIPREIRQRLPRASFQTQLKPLDAHLAELLNPALNKPHVSAYTCPTARPPRDGGTPQAGFAAGDSTPVLRQRRRLRHMQSLKKLLMEGAIRSFGTARPGCRTGPSVRRNPRGGYRFTMKSEYEPAGDQPQAIQGAGQGRRREPARKNPRCCPPPPPRVTGSPARPSP